MRPATFLYDRGSSTVYEDGLIVKAPFYGVVDALSAPFCSTHPQRRYGALTGGEAVARAIESVVEALAPEATLDQLLDRATACIRALHAFHGVSSSTASVSSLAGATIAVAKVEADATHVAQLGDSFAIWRLRDGQIGMTPNQVRGHDTRMNAAVSQLMAEIARERGVDLAQVNPSDLGRIRGEMWNRFYSVLRAARDQDVNNSDNPDGYGLLNGQESFRQMLFRRSFPVGTLTSLLLVSDGMIPWEIMKGASEEEIATQVCSLYDQGKLARVLSEARRVETTIESRNYISFAEATGVALEF